VPSGTKPGCALTRAHAPRRPSSPGRGARPRGLVLGAAAVAGRPARAGLRRLVRRRRRAEPHEASTSRCGTGLTPALGFSALTLLLGGALFAAREPVRDGCSGRSAACSAGSTPTAATRRRSTGVDRLALRTTAVVQTGSLPVYLGMVLLTLVLVPGTALLLGHPRHDDLRGWDRPLQPVVAIVIAVAAVATARAHRRFTAVLYLGAVGYGIAVLFVLQGGPDLALTQFLVETLALVIFVFVLRRLPPSFSRHRLRLSQGVRLAVALSVGAFVTTAILVSGQARTAPPASQAYLDRALPEGGGSNVVNVVLVDFRGFDTLGEITVLAVAAMGIASLVLAGRGRRTRQGAGETALTPLDRQAADA
jgi:multicomponent Na+:H+ antiporter subunit A